jgi:membrane protease YdiL (CAAX protease family)
MSDPENAVPGAPVQEVEPQPKTPFWDYVDLLAFLAAAFPSILLAGLITRGLFHLLALPVRGKAPELLAAQFLAYLFWFTCLYLLLRLRYDHPFWESLGWVRAGEHVWRQIGFGVAAAVVISIAGMLLRTPDLDMPMKHLLSDRTAVLLVGLAAITLGPICEELAFRGFLMPLLVRSLGPAAAIVLSALPFALLHGPQYAWSWRHVMLITLAGSAFGYTRWRSGSTAAAAIVHAAYNATFFAAYVLIGKDLPAKW